MSLLAEQSILASLLFDGNRLPEISAELSPGDFSTPSHGKIFAAMLKVFNEDGKIDAAIISAEPGIDVRPLLDLGSAPFFDPRHVQLIKDAAAKRNLNLKLREALINLEEGQSVEEIITSLESMKPTSAKLKSFSDIVTQTFKEIEGGSREVLKTSIGPIDFATGGIQLGDLWVLAARTSQGKSALALAIAEGIARTDRHVIIVSVEGTEFDVSCRMLARASQVENIKIRTGNMETNEYSRVINAANEIGHLPIQFLHREYSWDRIRAAIETEKQKNPKVVLFVLDYIGLINAPVADRQRYLELGRITSESKRLCEKLNIAGLLVSQLNRNLDMRKDTVPRLSDLRESGNIEQDSDVVAFLYQPDVNDDRSVELIIDKNRNGFTGSASLKFDRRTLSFSET